MDGKAKETESRKGTDRDRKHRRVSSSYLAEDTRLEDIIFGVFIGY